MQPLVSIIFPLYNAEQFMRHALDSIVNQSYINLEILCFNDGSSDLTQSILEEYAKNDKRIVIINNGKNLGLIDTLNKASELVRGEFFARMDADDYSVPNRISKLVDHLNSNPEIQLVSSGYNYFKKEGKSIQYVPPVALRSDALKILSLFATPVTHAALCGRSSLLKGDLYKYDSNFAHAEDFELFSRLAWNGIKISNINEPLYWVRLHNDSVSKKYALEQTTANIAILKRNLKFHVNYSSSINDLVIEIALCRAKQIISFQSLKEAFSLIKHISNYSIFNIEMSQEGGEEIKKFVSAHKLNMFIQSNKVRFRNLGIGNLGFFLKSLLLLDSAQLLLLTKKFFK